MQSTVHLKTKKSEEYKREREKNVDINIPCHSIGKHRFLGISTSHLAQGMMDNAAPQLVPFQPGFPELSQ